MEFRLTYAGPLYATQRDPCGKQQPKHTENRHSIRKAVHGQLKDFWKIREEWASARASQPSVRITSGSTPLRGKDELARHYAMFEFNFVPLVTAELDLLCTLDILFLRPDEPGKVWAGDIDNRIKTLLDALRIPEANEKYVDRAPDSDQHPFFVLLEDDKLITGLSVETDRLLEPINGDNADARIVITVRIRPYHFNIFNMEFA